MRRNANCSLVIVLAPNTHRPAWRNLNLLSKHTVVEKSQINVSMHQDIIREVSIPRKQELEQTRWRCNILKFCPKISKYDSIQLHAGNPNRMNWQELNLPGNPPDFLDILNNLSMHH